MKITVKGHSGCSIDIVNDGKRLSIYKGTRDPKYIDRLYMQARKQQEAAKCTYQHIRIPEIYEIDKTDDHLNIKMEYVYSKNYIDYFEDAGFDNISYFVRALKIFVDAEIAQSPLREMDTDVVMRKFEDVCSKCSDNGHIASDNEVNSLLMRSKTVLQSQLGGGKISLPIGICHGDLTFSNILFNGNNYYLIDFLDSFVESPLLDLVKIRQDSCYEWSRLMYEGDVDRVRLSIISRKIDEEIDQYYSRYEWYKKYYQIFQLLNFLRILQYAKEERVIVYLKKVISQLL